MANIVHIITNGDAFRQKSVQQTMKAYELDYQYHKFERNREDGRKGCLDSHLAMYQYARDNKMEYIWVAEDNVIHALDKIPASVKSELEVFMKTNQTWKVIYVGGWFLPLCQTEETDFEHVRQTNSLHGTSMYIIHRRLYEELLDRTPPAGMDSDRWIQQHSFNQAFLVYPFLFYRNRFLHSTNKQNIPNWLIDSYRHVAHHPTVFRSHEWLIHNGYMTATSIMVFLLTLVLMIFAFCQGHIDMQRVCVVIVMLLMGGSCSLHRVHSHSMLHNFSIRIPSSATPQKKINRSFTVNVPQSMVFKPSSACTSS